MEIVILRSKFYIQIYLLLLALKMQYVSVNLLSAWLVSAHLNKLHIDDKTSLSQNKINLLPVKNCYLKPNLNVYYHDDLYNFMYVHIMLKKLK